MQPGNLQKSVTYIKPKATEIQNPSNIVTLSVAEVKVSSVLFLYPSELILSIK